MIEVGEARSHAALTAAVELERWSDIRAWLGEALVAIGLAAWLMAIWPGFIGGAVRVVVLALWAGLFAIFVGAVLATRRWRLRLARAQARTPPVR